MKGICESSTSDRISDLPAVLAERILSLLPLKDAARTATLSTQWSYRWRNVPQLAFDGDFARTSFSESASNVNKLMMRIYKAVLLHNTQPTTKFVLAIPGLRPCDEMDGLILYLAEKGIQDFTLRMYVYHPMNFASLFAALELHTLKLRGCEFNAPSGFVGFNKLTRLELANVTVEEGFSFDLLGKYPLLEDLHILDCYGFSYPEIEAPCLKVFFFRSWLGKICFKYAPLLSVVTILDRNSYLSSMCYEYQEESVGIVAAFASLPALQQLRFGLEFLLLLAADDHVPKRLPTPLHHLTVLEMDNVVLESSREARVLVCLILSSPNLQKNIRYKHS